MSKNSPCPCGSGRKFKRCCKGKVADPCGPVTDEMKRATDRMMVAAGWTHRKALDIRYKLQEVKG